eukprot:2353375-Pleurochrysis_carterae.AAC.2
MSTACWVAWSQKESNEYAGGNNGCTGELHDRANCTFGGAVELMDVRRAGRGVHTVIGQKFGELA